MILDKHVILSTRQLAWNSSALAVAGSALSAVKVSDKRVVNGKGDINQLAPFKYPWAWKYFINANKNHWTPLDVNMSQDIEDYHHKLPPAERHVYDNVLAYLTTSDILAMRNIGLAIMEKMRAPELQIHHKIEIANRRLGAILRPDIDLSQPAELSTFVMSYLFFAAVFEGCWFYNGFSPIFALQRRGLMKGTAEQLQYIMRDEVMHCSFGLRTIKQILLENPVTLDAQ